MGGKTLKVLQDCSAHLKCLAHVLLPSRADAASHTHLKESVGLRESQARRAEWSGAFAGIFLNRFCFCPLLLSKTVRPTCSAAGAGGLLAPAVPARGLRVHRGARGRVLSPLHHRPLPGRHHPQRHHQDVHGRAQHLTLQRLLLD